MKNFKNSNLFIFRTWIFLSVLSSDCGIQSFHRTQKSSTSGAAWRCSLSCRGWCPAWWYTTSGPERSDRFWTERHGPLQPALSFIIQVCAQGCHGPVMWMGVSVAATSTWSCHIWRILAAEWLRWSGNRSWPICWMVSGFNFKPQTFTCSSFTLGEF